MGVGELGVKLFADGADVETIREMAEHRHIVGFTTNPTLMRACGVDDYERFAREAIEAVGGKPISFEVFTDDPDLMEAQAVRIASWGDNVYVKIPVTDTRGRSTGTLLERLVADGVQVNVTALTTVAQVEAVVESLAGARAGYISIFAGRIADTGIDPVPTMVRALEVMAPEPGLELIWASPREVLNIVQAGQIGCHIITLTDPVLRKLPLLGCDLDEVSLGTVRMFHDDAATAGYTLDVAVPR